MWAARPEKLCSQGARFGWVAGCMITGLVFGASAVYAEIPSDFHVQSDRFDMEEEVTDAMSRYNYQYIQWLLDQEYPVPSIILHATARGMAISDVVYLLTRAQPENAQAFYDHAQEMLPNLPGWVCESRDGMDGRYYQRYTLDQLGADQSVLKVAERFFKDGGRLKPYPEWEKGKAHLQASVNELLELSLEEAERSRSELGKEDSWWYQTYRFPIDGRTPLFVSLYRDDKRIVIDADTETLKSLRQRGMARVPVVFAYNGKNFIPTSHIDKDSDAEAEQQPLDTEKEDQQKDDYINYNNGDITASEVIDRFFSKGLKVTPPREWHKVDHHLNVQVKELRELFEAPNTGDMDPGKLQQMQQQLGSGGLKKPLLITLDGNSGERWVDNVELIAAAESLGMDRLPTAFLYHDAERWPCGVPAACQDWICDAAVAGGASSSVCGPGKTTISSSPFPPSRSPSDPGGFDIDTEPEEPPTASPN